MIHISTLGFNLLSQGLITVEIIRISPILIEIWSRKNMKLQEIIFKLYFQLFFFSNCHRVIPFKVSKVKTAKYTLYLYVLYIFNKIKKRIFTSKLLGYIKTFKTKNFPFFLYIVQGAWCGGRRKFLSDRRIFKNGENECQSTVASALKGYVMLLRKSVPPVCDWLIFSLLIRGFRWRGL